MSDCCGCCVALKPRYKRLVDSIFPADPKDGLVKSNMDKLTFFAMKSPDKLDRIGEYLAQRLSRDVYRQKYNSVNIAMEALDTLLVTCHAQSLNLFVESFLKMVQKLLECSEVDLQCLATASFVKFANIEEDTPSYHRRYDFFVSKFSSMCHSNDSNIESCTRLRISGLHGLQGVVRKTVTDDLQCNIWKPTHMDKIVPSLLFNMQSSGCVATEPESPKDEDNPTSVAEMVFRDFICRASYGNINAVIRPVLTHLDNHNLWVPNDFAVKCFKIIMYSVQAQYGYIVVQMLMNHLDENSKEYAKIKASIVDVLSETVLIAAGGSIGILLLV
jgi:protein EFR3